MTQSRHSILGAVAYFIYDVVNTDQAPCKSIFEQTSAQFELKLKTVATEGNLVIGRQQVQELTDNAQTTALNLKTCCIVLNAGNVDADQFLQCQAAGRKYDAQLDLVLRQILEAQSAQQSGDQAAIEASRDSLAAIVQEAQAISDQLRQSVSALRKTSPDDSDGPAPSVEPELGATEESASTPPADPGVEHATSSKNPGDAVTVTSSLLPTIVVSRITRFSEPTVEEIFVVAAGTHLSSFTPTQRASEFGLPMIVETGTYDIVLDVKGQSMVTLIEGLEVASGQQLNVDADALVSFIVVRLPNQGGFPSLEQLFVLEAGTATSGYVQFRFSTTQIGMPMLVEPGVNDVYVDPSGGNFVALRTGVDVLAGHGLTLNADDGLAAIVHEDPQITGFELEDIYLVTAGTDIGTYHNVYQRGAGFGAPMLVTAGGSYDVVLRPAGGNPVKVQQSVSPASGAIVRFGEAE